MLPNDYTVKKEEGEYELIPDGLYQVEISDVELRENQETPWGVKNKLRFTMLILEGEYRGKKLVYSTSESFSSGGGEFKPSNLYIFACAALKKKLVDTDPFTINSLLGAQVQADVTSKKSKTGREYNVINTVVRVKDLLPSMLADAERDVPLKEDVSPEEIEEGLDGEEKEFTGEID